VGGVDRVALRRPAAQHDERWSLGHTTV